MPHEHSSFTRSTAVLFCLFIMHIDSAPLADEVPNTAAGLLTAFSGEDAQRYRQFFQYSEGSRIVGIEAHAVGNDATTARYSGQETPWQEVNNILRIRTADGFEGISGVDSYYQDGFSDEHLQELQSIAAELFSMRSLDPVEVGSILDERRSGLSDAVRASIDIALWDLAARKADLPLHELLGAKRDSIAPYASLPFYDALPEYVQAVNQYAELGYTNFKFHVWGDIERDLELVDLVQQTFADTAYRFMIDLEGVYDFDEALRLGQAMDQGLFDLLEGPIDDSLLAEYAKLRDRLTVQIIPAGYNYYSAGFIRRAIETGSWDAGRFDATVVGGLSEALRLLIIANEAALPIDIQSWGHSLAQAANLHLMLANERTWQFEAPMPKDVFEFGMFDGNLLVEGKVAAPKGPGLGIRVDWAELATADFYVYATVDPLGLSN